jgi:hypothetical protein
MDTFDEPKVVDPLAVRKADPKSIIRTFGKVLQSTIIDLITSKPPETGFQLISWDGSRIELGPNVRTLSDSGSFYYEKLYGVPQLDPTLLQAMRFPAEAMEYSSEHELFTDISGNIRLYSDLSEELSRLLSYCVFASWFPDCAPKPLCISILGPESRQGRQLFRLLSCFFRRPLLMSDVNLAALCSLPAGLAPTLFLEQPELTRQAEKALYVPSARDTFIPWKGRLVNLSWTKVIRTEEPLNSAALGAMVIEIPVDPGNTAPALEFWTQEKITKEFQAKLLMYRLKNRLRVPRRVVEFPGLLPEVREIAYVLCDCAPEGVFDFQAELTSLLEAQNQQAQAETGMNLNAILLDVLLSFCHQQDRTAIRVAEVADGVNKALEEMDETIELSPKAVGGRLRSLGLYTQRIDALSRGLLLTDAMRNLIHKLAWGCRAVGSRDVDGCKYCQHFVRLEKNNMRLEPLPNMELVPKPEAKEEQPPVESKPATAPTAQNEDPGASRWIETKEDQEFIDKLKKDSEF